VLPLVCGWWSADNPAGRPLWRVWPAVSPEGWQCWKVSAPTVDRPGASSQPEQLPPPLRFLAAIGRVILRVRRRVRFLWRRIARLGDQIARSPLVAAPIAASSVAAVGLLVLALAVAGAWWGGVEPPGPWPDAAGVVGSVWVMSYGVPVRLLGVDYSLLPWGLMVIPLWLGHQAGRWLVRVVRPQRIRTLLATWFLAVAWSTSFVVLVSVLADIPDVQTSARRAAIAATVVGLVSIGTGLWRASDLARETTSRIVPPVRVVLRGTAVAVVTLIALACVVLLVAVASSFGEISRLFAALSPTVSDAIVLSLLSLAYLPTLVIWSLAYFLGAGISLGGDVLVSPFVAVIAPTDLPAFPPLAALPETSGPASWALPALTVLAGAFAGLSVSRFAAREGPLVRISLALAASVLAAGVVYALLLAAAGSLGDGRFIDIGPDAGLGALLAGVGLVVGALPTSVLRARRRPRTLAPVAEDGPVGAEPGNE